MAPIANTEDHEPSRHLVALENGLSKVFRHMKIAAHHDSASDHNEKQNDRSNREHSSTDDHTQGPSKDVLQYSVPENRLQFTDNGNHSEDVANRNMKPLPRTPEQFNSAQSTSSNPQFEEQEASTAKSGKLDIQATEKRQGLKAQPEGNVRTDHDVRSPSTPIDVTSNQAQLPDSAKGVHSGLQDTSSVPPKSNAQVEDTVDTSQHTRVAPAVTHETIQPVVHEIKRKEITRDIHNTHIFHRILPVIDVEWLPARHFTRSADGELHEIPAPPGWTMPELCYK